MSNDDLKKAMPNEVVQASQGLVMRITEDIQRTISNLSPQHRSIVEATFLAAMGSMGAVQILSAMLGKSTGGLMSCDNINPVSTLYAGLLAAKMGSTVEQQEEFTKVTVPFGWGVLHETLEATERLLGRAPDESLQTQFVEFLRNGEKDPVNLKFSTAPIASSRMQ